MEKRYINENRYKKNSQRKRRTASTVKSNLIERRIDVKENISIKKTSTDKKIKTKSKIVKKKKRKATRSQNIFVCVILLIVIAIVSRAILKDEGEPFIPNIFSSEENEQVIKLGIITEESLQDESINNVILSELSKYSNKMLLKIDEGYNIIYEGILEIKKNSNKEYILIPNRDIKISSSDIKVAIETAKNNNIYSSKLSNVKEIIISENENIKVTLVEDDPYFVYNLDIPIQKNNTYVINGLSNSDELILDRAKNASEELPKGIIVKKYKNMYKAVEAYKKKEIDMFVTNASNVKNILGKYEYNIKSYRNGETVFLFGNPKSELYLKEEVRTAIAYSIDRDSIIKDVLNSKGEKIDLPYIYDNIKYKYDVYAAENLLLTNEYTKTNKVYSKIENGKRKTLELDLIVNKDDSIKISVANKIKNNLNSLGIAINVEKLSESAIQKRIKSGKYDLLLASVNLNNNPDISFLESNLLITSDVKESMTKISESEVKSLPDNIKILQIALSDSISSIGIYADVSYLVHSIEIIGIENISYMNVLKNILSIVK